MIEATPHDAPPAPAMDPYWLGVLARLLDFDVLRVRQKILAIAQKYHVMDEAGNARFFVVRPPRLALNIAIGLVFTALNIALLVAGVRHIMASGPASVPVVVVVLIVAGNVLGIAQALMAPYRHISVFSDESETWRIFTITQDNKIGFFRRYTLHDCLGQKVAVFRRNVLLSLLRRSWVVETPSGELIARVHEDSWARALLRRYLAPLVVFLVLRTNFDFVLPSGRVVGRYDRLLKVRDEYLLDLRGDPQRLLDRRVALAMAILLDTGEMR